MDEKNDFEEIISNLCNKSTLDRAASISDQCIRILEIDKDIGFVEAEIQGNKLMPYRLTFNISQSNLYDVIYHDCPDYLARKKPNNKFCKHIVKFLNIINDEDSDFAIKILREFNSKIAYQTQTERIDLTDMDHFINMDLTKQLDFEYKGFNFFFDLIELDNKAREVLKNILIEARKLPAALRGFHGGYEGGLFDHILLVTNYTYFLNNTMKYQVDIKKAILTAVYHDFGKISYYSYKKKNLTSKITVAREELDIIHDEIVRKFNYEGRHYHVEEGLAVLKRHKNILFYDEEIYKAIIFHHGQWSEYYPIDMNDLANLIHKADMIASQTHFV